MHSGRLDRARQLFHASGGAKLVRPALGRRLSLEPLEERALLSTISEATRDNYLSCGSWPAVAAINRDLNYSSPSDPDCYFFNSELYGLDEVNEVLFSYDGLASTWAVDGAIDVVGAKINLSNDGSAWGGPRNERIPVRCHAIATATFTAQQRESLGITGEFALTHYSDFIQQNVSELTATVTLTYTGPGGNSPPLTRDLAFKDYPLYQKDEVPINAVTGLFPPLLVALEQGQSFTIQASIVVSGYLIYRLDYPQLAWEDEGFTLAADMRSVPADFALDEVAAHEDTLLVDQARFNDVVWSRASDVARPIADAMPSATNRGVELSPAYSLDLNAFNPSGFDYRALPPAKVYWQIQELGQTPFSAAGQIDRGQRELAYANSVELASFFVPMPERIGHFRLNLKFELRVPDGTIADVRQMSHDLFVTYAEPLKDVRGYVTSEVVKTAVELAEVPAHLGRPDEMTVLAALTIDMHARQEWQYVETRGFSEYRWLEIARGDQFEGDCHVYATLWHQMTRIHGIDGTSTTRLRASDAGALYFGTRTGRESIGGRTGNTARAGSKQGEFWVFNWHEIGKSRYGVYDPVLGVVETDPLSYAEETNEWFFDRLGDGRIQGSNRDGTRTIFLVGGDYDAEGYRLDWYIEAPPQSQGAVRSSATGTAPVTISGGYTERRIDSEGDRVWNQLILDFHIVQGAAATGQCFVAGYLCDAQGNVVSTGFPYGSSGMFLTDFPLRANETRTVSVAFSGEDIRRSGASGSLTARVWLMFNAWDPVYQEFRFDDIVASQFGELALYAGGVTDRGQDTNGDGLFDRLRVETSINATRSTSGSLSGCLKAPNGQVIDTAFVDLASASTGTVALAFDGRKVRQAGLDGPYTVSLALEQATGGYPTFFEHTTAAYDADTFAAPPVTLSGVFAARVVDSDNDRRYERLGIDVGLQVAAAGTYEVSGALYDGDGNFIELASTKAMLAAGARTATLSFSGTAIGNGGVNGPYALKYLAAQQVVSSGQGFTAGLDNAWRTPGYAARVFEADFAAVDLGTVDFLAVEDSPVYSGDGWYLVQATRAGYLTVASGTLQSADRVLFRLYDQNRNVLATSHAVGSVQRLDRAVQQGDRFYVKIARSLDSPALNVVNLVQPDAAGSGVTVFGTAGADSLAASLGSPQWLSINGVRYDSSLLPTLGVLAFQGGNNLDTVVLTGSAANDTARLRPGSGTLTSPDYQVTLEQVESVTVQGGGGDDKAYLYDSTGSDTFYGYPSYAYLSGTGFYSRANGFDKVYVYATAVNVAGATDRANLYDSTGSDTFYGCPTYASLTGPGFYNYAGGFDKVCAYATAVNVAGAVDKANLYDSTGSDSFYGYPAYAYLAGTGFYNYAKGFDKVYAYATAVNASGATDTARLYDSTGSDRFSAYPTYAYLHGTSFYNYTKGFDKVFGYATAANTAGAVDRAFLYDSTGNDKFYGRAVYGYLFGSGFYNYATGFNEVTADGTKGGTNRLDIAALDYLFQHPGTWS